MLDIRDFGAVGDGVADDAASMQAALDACAGAGGEVFIPSGTYRITRSLLPHSNTLVMGGGYASAIMITDTGWDTLDHAEPPPRDNVNKGAITLAGEDPWGNPSRYLDNVRITNLRIFGGLNTKYEPTESDPFRYCPSFVFLQHCNRCTIDNCWFEDGHYSSIFVEGGARERGGPAFWQDTVNELIISSNHFHNVSYVPIGDPFGPTQVIQVNGARVIVQGNIVGHCGSGFYLTGMSIDCTGNVMRDMLRSGIDTLDQAPIRHQIIANNLFETIIDADHRRTGVDGRPVPVIGFRVGQPGDLVDPGIMSHDVLLANNAVQFTISDDEATRDIQVIGFAVADEDTKVLGNKVDFEFKASVGEPWSNSRLGFEFGNGGHETTIEARDNSVRYYSNDNSGYGPGCTGFICDPARDPDSLPDPPPPPPPKLTIYSAHNMVSGLEGHLGGRAWEYWRDPHDEGDPEAQPPRPYQQGSGSHLIVHMEGDVSTGGYFRCGEEIAGEAQDGPVYIAPELKGRDPEGGYYPQSPVWLPPMVLPRLSSSDVSDHQMTLSPRGGIERGPSVGAP